MLRRLFMLPAAVALALLTSGCMATTDSAACSNDLALVTEGLDRLLLLGNGAMRQREIYTRTGRLGDLLAALAEASPDHSD